MPLYEFKTLNEEFTYRIWYSLQTDSWEIDGAEVDRHGKAILPKRPLRGNYKTEAEAIARGVQWCETIINFLKCEPIKDNY